MMPKATFKPIDTAFAILFALLIAVAGLNVATVTEMGGERSAEALQIPVALERFRALERNLRNSAEYLRHESMDWDAKVAILDIELEHIEYALRDLGTSALNTSGLTRLVEPYMHIREVRWKIKTGAQDVEVLLAIGGPLDRALQATQFVLRNNITRLGEELTTTTASINGAGDRAKKITFFGGLAALLAFVPVRLMASRTAAKPLSALKAATRALAEQRWNAVRVECASDDAVGDLVDAKDAYTSNHSCKVSQLSELLARALGLPDEEVKEIAYGALLHDVGKIGVPDEVINKPGKLTTDEFARIQQHPVVGGRIVAPLDGSELLLPPVRHHHEHWNGGGYPDGLRGEQIPLAARIVAVADVFESLISDRPYRSRMSIEQALDVLRSEADKKLEPRLVDTFISEVLPRATHLLAESPAKVAPDDCPTDRLSTGEGLQPAVVR